MTDPHDGDPCDGGTHPGGMAMAAHRLTLNAAELVVVFRCLDAAVPDGFATEVAEDDLPAAGRALRELTMCARTSRRHVGGARRCWIGPRWRAKRYAGRCSTCPRSVLMLPNIGTSDFRPAMRMRGRRPAHRRRRA